MSADAVPAGDPPAPPGANSGDQASPSADFRAAGFAHRTLETPAGQMSLHEAGSGEPIVFLHGIGGGASSWIWIAVAPAFASDHRVVVPDWVGWGESAHPPRMLLFEDYVAGLEALLDHIGAPTTVVAQSLASGFALALAERRPGLISRLVLHTPTGGKDFGRDIFGPVARATLYPLTRSAITGVPFYRALFHRRRFIESWLRQQGFLDAAAVTPRIVDAFCHSARQPNAAWSALPFVNGRLRYDLVPYLQRSTTKISIFCGAEDSVVGVAATQRLAEVAGHGAVAWIDRARSCPELEQPAAVIAAIRTALSPDGRPSGLDQRGAPGRSQSRPAARIRRST